MDVAIRVLLVEDNDVFRESLEFLLERRAEVTVVGAVADGSSAARAFADADAAVAVIDYRLPDLDGAAAAAEILERSRRAGIVFLSASAGPEERDAAARSGFALVRKDEGIDRLVDEIRAAARRGET